MDAEFPTINKEFLCKLEDYIKVNAEMEKEEFSDVPDRIFKSVIAFQYLCTKINKDLSLEEIYEKHLELGSVGSGHGVFTKMLEKIFGSSKTFKKHTMLHDVFSKFYSDFEEGPGNNYASPAWLPSSVRDRPFVGQISGLRLCSKVDFSYK